MDMPETVENPALTPPVSENGHSNGNPVVIPKQKRIAPKAWLEYAFKPGDPRQKAAQAKAIEANRAKRARAMLELEIGDNPTRILSEQVKDTRLAISRCKTADSRAKLTKVLIELVQTLAKLQAAARPAESKPKSGSIEPVA